MAIVKPETMKFTDKKIRMLIAGYPGIGKTTLALSSPAPLYIDVDLSADRIDRNVLNLAVGVTRPRDYRELRADLGIGCSEIELEAVRSNLAEYQTIVVDTGGKLLTVMGNYATQIDTKYSKRDGSLSQAGYGWLGTEFARFLDHIIYNLDKHIVIVFHTVEERDGDDVKLRIKAVGSTKNNVWEVMDLGGFVEMRGNMRTIGFDNCERYFAKGTRNIHGVRPIPELGPGVKNDFLTKLFEQYNELSAAEAEQAAAEKAAYDAVMEQGKALIETIIDDATANAATQPFKALPHALTSKRELATLWNDKIKQLDLFWDKVLGEYTPAPPKENKEAE